MWESYRNNAPRARYQLRPEETPIEPLVGVRHARDAWAPALAVLQVWTR